jgi:hypothetical protein
MPLGIMAFRKKDGGISGCSKKSIPKSERFFDNRYKRRKTGSEKDGKRDRFLYSHDG